jgi:hypothetical protein
VRGFNVAWNKPCKLRLAVLFECRYVDGAAVSGALEEVAFAFAFPLPEDDRREWFCWCDEDGGSRSVLGVRDGARECTRDGTWLVLLLADRLGGVVSGGLPISRCAVSIGGGVFCDSERRSSELTYSRSPWPMGGET